MTATIPDYCLILLAGDTEAATKAAARYFAADELVTVGPGPAGTPGLTLEFALALTARRLADRKLVGILAPTVGSHSRASVAATAKAHFAKAVALIVGDETGEQEGLASRLAHEGFNEVLVLPAPSATSTLPRLPLDVDMREQAGPFDIIGDVHGCTEELVQLLAVLGHDVTLEGEGEARRAITRTSAGRRVVFVGDLVDRGPASADALRIAMAMVEAGQAFAVPGNHDVKFLRWLKGAKVKIAHGLQTTIADVSRQPESFRDRAQAFIDRLANHLWLDGGRLVVAHAGIRADMIGRISPRVREFCLYGDTSGETDDKGLPVRYHWAADYDGDITIVYGHTPVAEADWVNATICIDTGCCFGGSLTALRWPEREVISVPARRAYAERLRPFGHPPVRPSAARRAS